MLEGFAEALGHIGQMPGPLLALLGMVLGAAAVILPGITGGTIMVLALPLLLSLDVYSAFIFLAAVDGAGGFAGSATSILLGVPGDSANAATVLDGHPLARRGKAGVAIGASAAASIIGSVLGLGVVIIGLPILGAVILAFAPSEFFALSVAGIALIGTVSTGSPLRGIIAGLLGMLAGFIGNNPIAGGTRFTFGTFELFDGVGLVSALIGLFLVPELFNLMRSGETISREPMVARGVWQGVREVLSRPVLVIRSCLIGAFTGLIPGIGQVMASWMSYFVAARMSKNPETFGTGNIEGVIAPGATIDTKEATSVLPLFIFGLPSGATMAIYLSVFSSFGVVPGQQMLANDMPLIWVIVLTLAAVSIGTSLLGLAFAETMVKLTLIPIAILAPLILVFGVVGAYVDQGSLFGIGLVAVFGVLGIVMERLHYSRAALLVGLVLLPFAERNFFQAVQLNRGGLDFWIDRPITIGIFVVIAVVLLAPLVRRRWARRVVPAETRAVRAAQEAVIGGRGSATDRPREQLAFAVVLLAITAVFFVQTFGYDIDGRAMPLLVEAALAGSLLIAIAQSIVVIRQRRASAGPAASGAAEAEEAEESRESPLAAALWLAAYPVALILLGVIVSSIVYTLIFVVAFEPKQFGIKRAAIGVASAASVGALLYLIFVEVLHVPLFPGVLPLG